MNGREEQLMNPVGENVLKLINGPVICRMKEKSMLFSSGEAAAEKIPSGYIVSSITVEENAIVVVLERETTVPNDLNADWVKEHLEIFGKSPDLFDGV